MVLADAYMTKFISWILAPKHLSNAYLDVFVMFSLFYLCLHTYL